ncbi:fumarylacetoacetate hydrolase family protein [Beijerinckia sp. L45]|uniref:fumarylacetoacetate hydrolase family protein n=1 Tax=Beijerinckia sp. L45 TaxID=1641855 RepID=UPI00131E86C7|nr:fumarylacetoacetate hydrolase family protein [Beijerinckia sp. L45]
MRLSSLSVAGVETIGLHKDDGVYDLRIASPDLPQRLDHLMMSDDGLQRATRAADRITNDCRMRDASVAYLPLLRNPGKIICVGRNYAAHAREGGVEPLAYPDLFLRCSTSLIGHECAMVRPRCSDKLDYEGELAFVIGRKARHVRAADAHDYVLGYSLFNEGTIRDYQRKSSQWTIGKNFDGTGAFGPFLVTSDELPSGAAGLELTTRLNGMEMQSGNTDDLIFPVDKLIEILTECMTLEPGDVVVTGTPSGVGYARTPPVFLKPGDVVEVDIEGMGTLRNHVADD